MIYTSRKRLKCKRKTSYFEGRSYRNFSETDLYHDAKNINWLPLYTVNDVNAATDIFNSVLLDLFDLHAPITKIKCKSHQPKWITGEFLSLIDEREHLSNIHKRRPTSWSAARKREACQQVNRMKRILKRNYVQEALDQCV